MTRALVLNRVPGFEAVAHPDPPLRDAEIELRPFADDDVSWLVAATREHAELRETLLWPHTGRNAYFGTRHAQALVDLWQIGIGASWTVNAPERKAIVFAVVPDHGSSKIALGGAKIPGYEWASGQAARAMRLVAAWVRETLEREPYAAIPCRDERYIKWAEESGLAWDTKLPGAEGGV